MLLTVCQIKVVFICIKNVLFLLWPPGECYLMEWSDWSPCQSVCVKGQRLDFPSVQARSRAVIAQEPQNLMQCPDQEWEFQHCTGETLTPLTALVRHYATSLPSL